MSVFMFSAAGLATIIRNGQLIQPTERPGCLQRNMSLSQANGACMCCYGWPVQLSDVPHMQNMAVGIVLGLACAIYNRQE